ncbi:MAG: hypothetical protein H6Q65_1251 [Firmicutes bacterium]|nr:hypothetical protein [Bacillota bacterium]
MSKQVCKHIDISAKNTLVQHFVNDEKVILQVYSWICQDCGAHGSETRIAEQLTTVAI